MTPIPEFFTTERLMSAGASRANAKRIQRIIEETNRGIRSGKELEVLYTMESLVETKSDLTLLSTPGLGYRTVQVMLSAMEHAGFHFRTPQCVTRRAFARHKKNHPSAG